MATFPTLNPSSRVFTPGEYPHTPFTGLSGAQNRVRNSNVMLSSELRLTFVAITEAEMLSILSHYQAQQGSFSSFLLPSVVWNGTDNPGSYQLTGYGWIYKQPPTVEDLMCGGHNVELSLESVPPEGTALIGLDQTVVVSIAGGIATSASGVELTVVASIDGGVAGMAGLAETITWSLTAGTATADAVVGGMSAMVLAWLDEGFNGSAPGADVSVAVSLDAGTGNAATGSDQSVAVSIAGGTATGTIGDASFANVSLLLHMDGSNNSTTFTDSSSNGLTITANGDAKISTALSKFGSASAIFDGVGDYLNTASSALFNFGGGTAFTVECWVYRTDVTVQGPFLSQRITATYAPFELQFRSDYSGLKLLVGNASLTGWSTILNPLGATFNNTWHHVALVGTGTLLVVYLDGLSIATASQPAWTSANRAMYIGGGGDGTMAGRIDEVRITKGVARYTSNFTPPSAAFPDS